MENCILINHVTLYGSKNIENKKTKQKSRAIVFNPSLSTVLNLPKINRKMSRDCWKCALCSGKTRVPSELYSTNIHRGCTDITEVVCHTKSPRAVINASAECYEINTTATWHKFNLTATVEG